MGEPAMLQSWHDLCFLHYPVPAEELRSHIPNELEIDTFPDENRVEQAWVGIVAFTMSGIRFPGLPASPWLSKFPETNVRTYVHRNGKNPGVWFFSLDASRRLACEYARKFFGLNYLHSDMQVQLSGQTVDYKVRRLDEPHASMTLQYEHETNFRSAEAGTFEFWLVERYQLYTLSNGTVMGGQVHHVPYQLANISLNRFESDLAQSIGLPNRKIEHVIFSPGVDVEVFQLVEIS